MSWLRQHRKLLFVSALHATGLALLTLVWMNLSWEFGDEVIVARINQIARYEIFNPTNKVVEQFKKDLLFINTSYDKALADFEDDHGAGNRPITDRKKLADFLRIVSGSPTPPRLMVLDILFDVTSDNDSVLQRELLHSNNMVISSQLRDDRTQLAPWPGLNFALAQYFTTTGTFMKYNLINDTIEYLPAAMYHVTDHVKMQQWMGVVRSYPGWWMNSFIVDLPIRKAHLDAGEILIWNLGDALEYSIEEVQSIASNKIIIIGDIYDYDIHQTLLGPQPGPLIVANAYLGMIQGIPRIKFFDGFLIFMLYFISTLYVLQWRPHRDKLSNLQMVKWKVGKFILKYLGYLFIFSLYSIFLYLLTSRHFQLLIFGLYFNLFEYLIDRYKPNLLPVPEPQINVANVD